MFRFLLRGTFAALPIFVVGATKPSAATAVQSGTVSISHKLRPHCAPPDLVWALGSRGWSSSILGSAKIRPHTALILKNAAIGYRRFPNCVLVVHGYTDGLEAASDTQHLDARRARAVVHFLRRRGVRMRFVIRTYGDADPLVDTPKGAAELQNRRVEFNVTDPAYGEP